MDIIGCNGGTVSTDGESYKTGLVHGIMSQGVTSISGSSGGEKQDIMMNGQGFFLYRGVAERTSECLYVETYNNSTSKLLKSSLKTALETIFSHVTFKWEIYEFTSTNNTYKGDWFGVKIYTCNGAIVGIYCKKYIDDNGVEYVDNNFWSAKFNPEQDETTSNFTSYRCKLKIDTTIDGKKYMKMYHLFFIGCKSPWVQIACRWYKDIGTSGNIDFYDRIIDYCESKYLFGVYDPSDKNAYSYLYRQGAYPCKNAYFNDANITNKIDLNSTQKNISNIVKGVINVSKLSKKARESLYITDVAIDGKTIENDYYVFNCTWGCSVFVIVEPVSLKQYLCVELYNNSPQFYIIGELENLYSFPTDD